MSRIINRTLWIVAILLLIAALLFTFRNTIMGRVGGVSVPQGQPEVADLTLPDGLSATVFADGLKGPRFMTVGPDGTLFVAERGANRIVALPDRDNDGSADETIVIADGLDQPSSIAFRPDSNQLYIGEVSRVSRIVVNGTEAAGDTEEIVDDLPERSGHKTTTVAFGADEMLYVSRGSSCNVCEENDPRLAAIWRYTPEGDEGELVMSGLRNAVGLTLNHETGTLWASNNGRDMLGNDLPPETIYRVEAGADAGWPRCHAGTIVDPDYGDDNGCDGVAAPAVAMQAHSAPLGLTFYENTLLGAEYSGDLFVAFHGSWNRVPPTGYKVVRIEMSNGQPTGEISDFATGWLREDGTSPGRPVGVTVATDGALLVSDDKAGIIYRISLGDTR